MLFISNSDTRKMYTTNWMKDLVQKFGVKFSFTGIKFDIGAVL